MTRTLRHLLLIILIGLSGSSFAQEISGRVLDEKKEPLPSAVVRVYQGGILKGINGSDFDGNYTVKPLDPGYYDVLVSYTGYDSLMVTSVIVSPGQRTTQNFNMTRHNARELKAITVVAYKKPLVDQDKPASHILTKEEINVIPTTQVTDIVSTNSSVIQTKSGGAVNSAGARSTGMEYVIDGVVVRNFGGDANVGIDMAQGSVDQIEVITSGIPANYGDVSGAVVNITSRGPSPKLSGDIRLQHSIDGYNNNLASFSIAGPIYKQKIQDGDVVRKKPVLGFALSGDVYDDKNRYPSYFQNSVLNGDVLDRIRKNPLVITSDNSGSPVYYYASDFVTAKDIHTVKIAPNNEIKEYRLNGKLDYQMTDNMRITGGGTVDYTSQDIYNRTRNLFAPEATPKQNTFSGRGYLRFTQKFGKANDTTRSIISNAFYKVQGDYQKTYQIEQDPKFKKNVFDYGYVGKFDIARVNQWASPFFTDGTDSLTKYKATVLAGSQATQITYTRSELNPILSNYTTDYYSSLNGKYPTLLSGIQAANGMINGDQPKYTYSFNGSGMFLSPGAGYTGYREYNADQYALSVDASFDLQTGKTRHAIEFGLYYQQRIERSYSIGATSLWSLMRQLVSSYDNNGLRLDKNNPIFISHGVHYTYVPDPSDPTNTKKGTFLDPSGHAAAYIPNASTDTIIYNYKNIGNSAFDQNLRKKLGVGATENINIDALDPSTFSLNMFSADELLASGHSLVNYFGYSYTGGAQTGSVNFNDFWTKKDANGNYTRPIAAFSPNYIAGYLLDKFTYKDIHFNVGVRIDRYSANTKVLKDPYSEYDEKKVSQVPGAENIVNGGKHPGNMGGDYVVYVDDNNSTAPNIIGYRSGNNWYDPHGKFINDPAVLKQYSGGRAPQPFLVNPNVKITDTSFNPNSSFTDYTPQVTVMPRISFNFPISDVADFYAHYDIYAQRPYPASLNNATPYDFYYLDQLSQQILANADLKPEKTYDYEVGFQQKVSDHAAVTLSAFYKERKDQIGTVPYLYAWPTSYYMYANRDFSTTKGTTINYDMRATNHLRMNLSYTLQFTEGSGSDYNSGNGGQAGRGLLGTLVDAGLPYLRYVTTLNYDSRHNIVGNIDYRYGEGEGPVVGGRNILQNAGIDIIAKARSGEPFTRYADPLQNSVIGGVNGSRLPWHFGVDLRLDKDFAINNSKKNKNAPEGVKPKRPLFIKGILQVNNLLNTQDILGVYGFTGRADDRGYLSSAVGRQYVPQQINPQSYSDLFRIYDLDPGHYNYARRISLAVEFNF
jgi:hypothetical protein